MIRRPPRSTPLYSSAASDVYKRQCELRIGAYRLMSDGEENLPSLEKLDQLFDAQAKETPSSKAPSKAATSPTWAPSRSNSSRPWSSRTASQWPAPRLISSSCSISSNLEQEYYST